MVVFKDGFPIRLLASLKRTIGIAILFLPVLCVTAQTTYYSTANGNWNSSSTWSTVDFGVPINLGTFPGVGDIALIGGSAYTITITGVAASCASLSITGNSTLNVGHGLTVTTTTTLGDGSTNGDLNITSTAGTKTFVGLVTVNTGATWNEAANEVIVFRGGITNNGTFNAGTAAHTFNTNSQTLTGTFDIPRVTVTGASVVLTNSNTLTVSTALAGTGRLTQGTDAVLNIGGASTITNMTATASGNTVNYTGADQTVHSNDYHHLGLTGSGTVILQTGTTIIGGDLTMSGSVATTAVTGLAIGGALTIGLGTSFTAGAFTHTIGGDFTNNGTFAHGNGTIDFNGAAQSIGGSVTTFNDLQLSGSDTKTLAVNTTISGILSITTGAQAGLSNANTYTSNSLLLGGAIQAAGTWGSTASAATNQSTYFSGDGLVSVATGAFSYYSIADGDWSTNTTWSTAGFGGGPAAGTPGVEDYVFIGDGRTVTITGAETCAALNFDAGTSITNTLTISSGSLTVSGSVTIPQTSTSGSNVLDVGAGSLTAGSLSFTSTASGAGHQVSISTGTATISGDITGIGASSTIGFSGAGLLQVGGSLFTAATGTLTAPTGTVEYNGASQSVEALPYNNLSLSGSGTKTLAATTTVSGDITVGDNVDFTVGGVSLTVNGATTIGGGTSGSLSITSTAGTKTFVGLVTINTGATWNEAANEVIVFRGGITNNGTFNAGTAAHTFNTNSQTLTGTFDIPRVTVTGASVVLTNSNTLTVSTALAGTGRLTQGTDAVLNIGGASTITNMTATASGNAVNYTGADQTVHSNDYHHLGLTGSGTVILQTGTTIIGGDLTMSGSVATTAVTGLAIGGALTIGLGTSFTAGAFTHTIGGDFTNNGTFAHGNGTIDFNGAAQSIGGSVTTFNDLQLSGSDTKTLAVNTPISGTLSIATGAQAGLSSANTYTSNSLLLGGAIQAAGTWGSTASAATNQSTYFSGDGLVSVATGAFSYYSIADGDWSTNTTWSTAGFGGGPAAGTPGVEDYVFIGDGRTVTITGAETCAALNFDAGTSITNTLTISSGSLTVSGSVTIPQTSTSGSNVLDVGAGSLTAGSLNFTSTASGAGHQVSISTGTATISGDITGIGASSTIGFSGAGLLQVGGSLFTAATGTLTAPTGTVEYNGASQSVEALPYNNLSLSGSGTKTLAATTTVSGDITVGDNVDFTVGGVSLTVNGATTIGGGTSGSLSITSTAGTKTFVGLVTINTGATWNEAANEVIVFRGGITNNGTFNAGTAAHTFNTNSQTLTGTFDIPRVTVTGASVVLTNSNTLTVSTALAGTGRLTQGTDAVLNIGGASTITNMTATASGNAVNYTGADQTINSVDYHHLTLSGSGSPTLQSGTTIIGGDFTMSGSVTVTAVTGMSIGGSLVIGSNASFAASSSSHTVGGDWVNDGIFADDGGAISFNGTTQSIGGLVSSTFNNVTLEGSGTKTFDVSTEMLGTFSVNTGVVADLGTFTTHTANTLILGGISQPIAGTWGSSASGAANQNDTYFSNTGYITIAIGARTYFSRADGPWNDQATWSTVDHGSGVNDGTFPVAGDYAVIGGGFTVSVTSDAMSERLNFDEGTSVTNTLTINSGITLTVADEVTIPQTVTSGLNDLNAGDGNLVAGLISFTGSGGGGHQVTIGTGTVTVSGDVTSATLSGTIQFDGAGLLQVGGGLFDELSGTLTAVSGSTVEYNGANQTVHPHNYTNLTLSGSGAKTLVANTTVAGDVTIGDNVDFTVGGVSLTVSGATTIGGGTSGSLSITGTAGAKTFMGLVTVNTGATWDEVVNETFVFRGGITNNGTFNAGTQVHTFNTNSQSLTGVFNIPRVTVTGASVVLNNNNTLTVSAALAGSGSLAQGTDAELNLGGISTITTLTATASGNTVNFTGADQTINSIDYHHLTLSGSGTPTLQSGTTTIGGDFTMSGTVSITAVTGLTIGGSLAIESGATFAADDFTHSVAGDWANNNPATNFNAGLGNIVFSGTGTHSVDGSSNFYSVSTSGSGTIDLLGATGVSGILSLATGSTINTNNNLTLISTSDALAGSIGNLTGVTFNGDVTVQRFMSAADNFDRFLSSPILNAPVSQLQNATPIGSFPVTGDFTGSSFPCAGCNNDGASLRWYRESTSGVLTKGYVGYPTGSNADPLLPGVGYDSYMWNATSDMTVSFSGTINSGNIDLGIVPSGTSITHTDNGNASADGWNLVGNPYPSAIVWDNGAGWSRTNIDPTVWVWDVVGRVWHSYNANTASGDLTNGVIALGQGFWVYAPSVGPASITINEGAKASVGTGAYYRKRNTDESLMVSILKDGIKESAFLVLDEEASASYDKRRDYPKIQLGIERMHVSLIKENMNLGYYAVASDFEHKIPVRFVAEEDGIYEISFEPSGDVFNNENYVLVDELTSERMLITRGFKYLFQYSADQPEKRFSIVRNSDSVGFNENIVQIFPNPTREEVQILINTKEPIKGLTLLNSTGEVLQVYSDHAELNKMGSISLSDYPAGMYLVRVTLESGVIVKRVVKN